MFAAENDQTGTFNGDAMCTVTQPPPPPEDETPAEAVDSLISDIENLGDDVPQGTKTSLTAPLRQVSYILTDDNSDNDRSACNRLNAFINQANAAEGRGDITQEQADDLINQAEEIREAIGC